MGEAARRQPGEVRPVEQHVIHGPGERSRGSARPRSSFRFEDLDAGGAAVGAAREPHQTACTASRTTDGSRPSLDRACAAAPPRSSTGEPDASRCCRTEATRTISLARTNTDERAAEDYRETAQQRGEGRRDAGARAQVGGEALMDRLRREGHHRSEHETHPERRSDPRGRDEEQKRGDRQRPLHARGNARDARVVHERSAPCRACLEGKVGTIRPTMHRGRGAGGLFRVLPS